MAKLNARQMLMTQGNSKSHESSTSVEDGIVSSEASMVDNSPIQSEVDPIVESMLDPIEPHDDVASDDSHYLEKIAHLEEELAKRVESESSLKQEFANQKSLLEQTQKNYDAVSKSLKREQETTLNLTADYNKLLRQLDVKKEKQTQYESVLSKFTSFGLRFKKINDKIDFGDHWDMPRLKMAKNASSVIAKIDMSDLLFQELLQTLTKRVIGMKVSLFGLKDYEVTPHNSYLSVYNPTSKPTTKDRSRMMYGVSMLFLYQYDMELLLQYALEFVFAENPEFRKDLSLVKHYEEGKSYALDFYALCLAYKEYDSRKSHETLNEDVISSLLQVANRRLDELKTARSKDRQLFEDILVAAKGSELISLFQMLYDVGLLNVQLEKGYDDHIFKGYLHNKFEGSETEVLFKYLPILDDTARTKLLVDKKIEESRFKR